MSWRLKILFWYELVIANLIVWVGDGQGDSIIVLSGLVNVTELIGYLLPWLFNVIRVGITWLGVTWLGATCVGVTWVVWCSGCLGDDMPDTSPSSVRREVNLTRMLVLGKRRVHLKSLVWGAEKKLSTMPYHVSLKQWQVMYYLYKQGRPSTPNI